MATDSTVAGYLLPHEEPVYDQALQDILQSMIVGVTGISGEYVRPRWMPKPPVQPDYTVNWVAFGETGFEAVEFAHYSHNPDGDGGLGTGAVEEDENYQVLHSFYGPDAARNCRRLIAALHLDQNRHTLRTYGIAVGPIGKASHVPTLLTDTWVPRVDLEIEYRRRSRHNFRVRNVLEIVQTDGLDNELWVTPIIVNPPT